MDLFENIPVHTTPEIKAAFYIGCIEFIENPNEIFDLMQQKHYQLRLVIWEDGAKWIKMLSRYKNQQLRLGDYIIQINNDGKVESRTKLSNLL